MNAMSLPDASPLGLPYLRRRPVRLILYALLTVMFLGMLAWRFIPIYLDPTFETAVAQKRVIVGMSREQVLRSWGSPYKIDVTYTDSGIRREQWVFEDWINSATVKHRYLYFEEGVLVGGWY
jgi:hypothetical protein